MSGRNYRLLLAADAAANLGDGVVALAMPWLATLLTRDPVLVAAVATAEYLPWLVLALPAGVLVDRVDRRRLMLAADGGRLVLAGCLVALALAVAGGAASPAGGPGPIAALSLLAFLLGTAAVLRGNAAQTLLPSLVPAPALERANGTLAAVDQVMARLAGPSLGGALVAVATVLPFALQVAALLLAVGLTASIRSPRRPPPPRQPFWPALLDGFRWLRRHPRILQLAAMVGAVNAVAAGGLTVLVLYAQEVLQLGARGYGLLLTTAACGGVAGGLVAPAVARRLGMRASLLLALAAFVVLHLLLGVFSSAALAGFALFVEAAGGLLWNVVTVSYRQRLIPDALLGRVNATYRFVSWGAMPVGTLGAGAIVSALSPGFGRSAALHAPFLVGAALCLGLLVYGWRRLRFP